MYKATGKASNHGDHVVLGVSLEYGKGKKQEVFMVAKLPDNCPDQLHPSVATEKLLTTENNDNRFFGSQSLAISAATDAWKSQKPVKELSGNFNGRDHNAMIRHLQQTAR